jgi:threonine 3-dehydrogenase
MWSTWDKMHVLLEQGSIDVDRILTHRMPVSEFEQGIALALSGECGKVVLDFD